MGVARRGCVSRGLVVGRSWGVLGVEVGGGRELGFFTGVGQVMEEL